MQGQETTTPLKPTRASFIRGLPLSMPVDEVIERGREVGIEIQPSDIHAARYYMRQAAAAEEAAGGRPGSTQLELGHGTAKREPIQVQVQVKPDAAKESVRAVKTAGVQLFTERPLDAAALGIAKPRTKPAPVAPVKAVTGTLDEQLRQLVMRVGTERTRAIIEEIEGLARRK